LDFYHRWVDDHPEKFRLVLSQRDLNEVLAGWEGEDLRRRRVGLVLMMEGAEAVRRPEELDEWYERGLRMVAPCWAGNRYGGGTGEPGPLTADGHALLETMAELGMMLDLTHMDEAAALEALDRYPGVLLASHSTSATLGYSTYDNRHLPDAAIRHLAGRGGVIGILPYNRFLRKGWTRGDPRQTVTLNDVVTHIDHVCQLVGDAAHVGIGSDFDGGFGLDCLPVGLDSIADLRFIGEALAAHSFGRADVEAILGGNWLRLLRQALPES
ncbi:MAG: membrane dipeptidase, partial [Chloroflexota bacterium]